MGAVRKRDLSYFSFFLHHFEKRLNGVIYRFLTRNGYDRYDPARFLDYKLEVLQMLLYCLPKFDPEQKTEFLKYAKHYIRDGLLFCRMIGEAGSFASLAEYRRVRQIGAIYNNSGKRRAEVVSAFAAQSGYKDDSVSADELLTIAQRNRSIVSLYRTEQDEDGEETGEDVTRDDSWNYAEILWNGIQAKAVTAAFEQLSYKEQWYLGHLHDLGHAVGIGQQRVQFFLQLRHCRPSSLFLQAFADPLHQGRPLGRAHDALKHPADGGGVPRRRLADGLLQGAAPVAAGQQSQQHLAVPGPHHRLQGRRVPLQPLHHFLLIHRKTSIRCCIAQYMCPFRKTCLSRP